ncbi:cytosolic carboxypeptidase 6, partial [Cricetulus griseus]
ENLEIAKCLSTGKWITKIWFIYTIEYYLAFKKTEIIKFEDIKKIVDFLGTSNCSNKCDSPKLGSWTIGNTVTIAKDPVEFCSSTKSS